MNDFVSLWKILTRFKPGENIEFVLGKWDGQLSLPGNGTLTADYVNGTQGRRSILEFFCASWNLYGICFGNYISFDENQQIMKYKYNNNY